MKPKNLAELYDLAPLGWPCEGDESGTALTAPYSAPSAGPPPWHLYRVTPTKALLVRDPGGATSWSFDG